MVEEREYCKLNIFLELVKACQHIQNKCFLHIHLHFAVSTFVRICSILSPRMTLLITTSQLGYRDQSGQSKVYQHHY